MTVEAYIRALPEPRRSEIRHLHELIRRTVPDLEPFVTSGMIGYGKYRYRYATGREGEWAVVLLGSGKTISVHATPVVDGTYLTESYAARFPKGDVGKSCVRFKKAADIDERALVALLRAARKATRLVQASE